MAEIKITEYEELKAHLWLINELEKGDEAIRKGKTASKEEIAQYFEEKHGNDKS